MAFHFNVPGAHAAGRIGVTLFLVLSGFLITAQLTEERRRSGSIALGTFFKKRLLRVGPALAAFLTAMIGAAVAMDDLARIVPAVVASAAAVANFSDFLGINLDHLSHMWTLALEMQFYALVPIAVLAIFSGMPGAVAIAVLAALCMVWNPSTVALVVGASLAWAPIARTSAVRIATFAAVGIVLILVSVGVDNQSNYYHLGSQVIAASGAGLVVISAVACGEVRWLRPLVAIGTVSYSLYLWHLPIAAFTFPFALAAGYPWWMATIASTAVSLAAAVASFHALERRFIPNRARLRSSTGPGDVRALNSP